MIPVAKKMCRVRGCFVFVVLAFAVAVTSARRSPQRARQLLKYFEFEGFNCAFQGQYPYVVSVRDRTEEKEHLCGGALIAKDAVLTAAHCVDPRTNQKATTTPVVYVGGELRNKPIQVRETVRAFPHPDWTGSIVDGNDIVILKLDKPTCVKTIPQLGVTDVDNRESLTFLGYGRGAEGSIFTSVLHASDLDTYNNTYCNKRYEILRPLQKNELCARGRTSAGLCSGDTGGPLIRRPTILVFKDVLLGIASFPTASCAETEGVAVFNDVYKNRKWMLDTMKSEEYRNAI